MANGVPAVAVVGCGYWGKNIVRNFAELGALVAVSDTDEKLGQRLAAEHRAAFSKWHAILKDPAIRGVAIAAPAVAHYALAREALAAGKDVFIEKPLALELSQAEELCHMAESAGRVMMVGHLLQYHPVFLKLLELVRGGGLGRLQYIYSNRLNLGKIRREENILWSFAPHDISMILALVGQEPTEIRAIGASYLHQTIADVTTTHMAFADGTRAHIFVSWLHPFKEQKLIVVGDAAMAVFDDGQPWDRKLVVFAHKIEWRNGMPQSAKAEGANIQVDQDEPLRLECGHFLECIGTRAKPRTDGREGLRVLRVLQEAQKGLSGETIKRAESAPPRKPKQIPGVFVHETAIVDDGVEIAAGTRIWHFSHVLRGVRIGRDCTIGQNVVIGPDVAVGDKCKVQNNVSLYKGVTLEEGVFCGPSCVFTNVNNPRAEIERKNEFKPTLVKRGASIGANATIVCGHTLGEYCFIGAGAVVTRDVPAFALMVGNPARRVGWMSRAGARLGPDLVCPLEHVRYREAGPDRLEPVES
jgi:predicted dehydrogenase/acetyltransferase-like isoleucine patch superfamily enzyme